MEDIIDNRLRSGIQFHDVPHRFRLGRGTGTITVELKIAQKLASVNQYPLLLVLLDLRMSYNTVDLGRIIGTLEEYRARPQMWEILETLWNHQEVVTRKSGYHSPNFKAARGTTQGGIISPTLFNVVVDNVVHTYLSIPVEDQTVAQEVLELNLGRWLVGFFAGDGMIGTKDSEWLQNALNVLIVVFRRYGLAANVAKSQTMMCQPIAPRLRMSEEAVGRRCTVWGFIPWMTTETNPMPLMRRVTDPWVHDGTSEKDAQDRSRDRLELAVGQSYRTPTTGIWHQIPRIHNAVPLSLTQLYRVLSDLERDLELFQLETLGI